MSKETVIIRVISCVWYKGSLIGYHVNIEGKIRCILNHKDGSLHVGKVSGETYLSNLQLYVLASDLIYDDVKLVDTIGTPLELVIERNTDLRRSDYLLKGTTGRNLAILNKDISEVQWITFYSKRVPNLNYVHEILPCIKELLKGHPN